MSRPSGLRKFVGPPAPAPAQGAPSPAPPVRPAPPEGAPAAAPASGPPASGPPAQAAPAPALPGPLQAALGSAPGPQGNPEEHCEFCATGIPSEHGHVADLEQSSLACACRACYLLFTAVPGRGDDPPLRSPGGLPPEPPAPASPGSGRTPLQGASPRHGSARYRSVPDRYLRDSSRPMSAMEWDELQIPVGLAFFLNSSAHGLGGFYPSPAGATECTLDQAAWERLAAAYPLLGAAEPDVEAVLLCRDSHASEAEYFIVPIDVCYELAGRMRMLWKGFDGGSEARASIDDFLARVRKHARDASPGGRPPAPLSRGTTPGAPGPRESPVRGDPPAGPTSPTSGQGPG